MTLIFKEKLVFHALNFLLPEFALIFTFQEVGLIFTIGTKQMGDLKTCNFFFCDFWGKMCNFVKHHLNFIKTLLKLPETLQKHQ